MNPQEVQKLIDKSLSQFLRREQYHFDKPVGFFGVKPTRYFGSDTGEATNAYGLTVNAPNLFSGEFDATLTTSDLPTGWSISRSGGQYTITHNLGDTKYRVFTTAFETGEKSGSLHTRSNNSFVLRYVNESGSELPTTAQFFVIRYNN